MFISTPFVHFTVNRLYHQGKITEQQRQNLIVHDRHINTIITVGAVVLLLAAIFA